jgi:mannose-6-phosphate isomerase-like protein (cupin superfamily)
MQFRDRTEVVKEGELIVVPKGVEHNPCTKNNEEVHVLLFEKLSTAHTGNVQHEKTQTEYPKI